jgi:predicted HicB family RNase H-like nuclease
VGVLHGHVIGLRDVITFQGDSVAEVTRAFRDSVDDYLEFCAQRGVSPDKPYSGHFILRVDPRLHRALSQAAEERGVSLNSLVEEQLRAAFLQTPDIPPQELASIVGGERPRAAAVEGDPHRGKTTGEPLRPGHKSVVMGPGSGRQAAQKGAAEGKRGKG